MKSKIILILILILGLVLRLYKLDSRPLGFTWDEAALGYNAYSLLKTGRDEYGKILPIVLKSFGDHKPGLYAYSTVPAIAIFGLTEFATRFSSAIFGTVLILVIYLLSRNSFAALLAAINPWALHFSRGAWEANLSLFLTTLAVVLFLRRKYLFSALFFGLTFWAYQGAKLFTPLLIMSLLIIFKSQINLRRLFIPLLLLLFTIIPILLGLRSQSGRFKVFSVLSYTRSTESVNEILKQDNASSRNFIFYLFHSEVLEQGRGILQRYLNHFSPYYLFIAGDWTNLRHSTPYYGYLHLPEIITMSLGLIYLIKSKSPNTKLLFLWLLLAPLPAAFSRDLVSGVRSLPMIVPLIIICGIGFHQLLKSTPLLLFYSFALLFSLVYYLDLYHTHAPYLVSQDWLYPYKPALRVVSREMSNYQNVVFTDKFGQPYIFVLFYLKIDPRTYQAQSHLRENAQGDVGNIDKFNQFNFRTIYWPVDRGESSVLFVGDQYELPEQDLVDISHLEKIGDITYPNGTHALRIVGLK